MKQEQPTIEGFKFCKKCGKYKPVSEFNRNSGCKDKLHNYCRDCMKAYKKSRWKYIRENLKEKKREYSKKQYYSTDYLEKKYLKRYRTSLEKVLAKKAYLENTIRWNKNPTYNMKQKMQGYESAIEKWKNKIREAEELMALYAENKAKAVESEKIEPAPLLESIKRTGYPTGEANEPKEETPKEEQTMTKEQLIALLADVPDYAQIIYVGDTDSRSNLVAAWKTDAFSVCIRNLSTNMPYIITEGNLYNLVSASMPFTN